MPWFFPSFLTPTFFVLGLLALSLPILFHFFRRTPKGNVLFSSLMFLQPSPPRLTQRSRVDNWLLLILRGLILLFIALAFGRVFFRQTDFLNISDLPTRRVAILVDTSASMFRGDLWSQAQTEFGKVIDGLGPNDEVAVFAFDSKLKTLVGFSSDESTKGSAKRELVRSALASVQPTWNSTNLGEAMIQAAEKLASDLDNDSKDQIAESQIVLISDLQSGSDLKSLRSFEWPEDVRVELKTVTPESVSNATLSVLENKNGISELSKFRVKVSNVDESTKTQFDLHWINQDGESGEFAGTIVVPPGQSRVIHVKPPSAEFVGIELSGDDDDFDNRFFLAYPEQVAQKVLFVGDNESIRNQQYFYLKKACNSNRFAFSDQTTFQKEDGNNIVFVVGKIDADQQTAIHDFCEQGGLVCIVANHEEMQQSVSGILGSPVTVKNAEEIDYALLSEIDFRNKIFAPFADPKYSNFSNIQFWKYRVVQSEPLQPIAKFDSGDLAISYCEIGKGQCYVFASGWHPADSQFALSTKFVGVMMSMMLKKLTRENLNLRLGELVDIAAFTDESSASIKTPAGDSIELKSTDVPLRLDEVDQPGIYQLSSSAQTKPLAFNLAGSESQTSRLDKELLEQEQVRLGTMPTATEKVEKERQRRDKELESRQKLWRWMLILALFTLFVETILSGYFAQRQTQNDLATQEP